MRARDEGSVSVLVVGLCAMLVMLVGVIGLFGRASWAQSRAGAAADLAALAAADATRGLTDDEPCRAAKEIARKHGAKMTECISRPDLGTVRVDVSFDPGKPFKAMKATAVAGEPDP